ncbi:MULTISPECIES: ThiF family adenylyltransferase [Erwiniaceae]|uniref:ThiF family adenylyltransferase n=2 Tax=Erwiniaceae TaxID=1903409 RepID=A0ACC5PQI3_ENTAG|nr:MULTISPECIES: ThiF family adenylyltransferase [Erwiniaceae]MBD8127131.1 ThiF family adenylyltransferase [Pantoea agglomerans]TKJ93862.1 thiamine biosynthesis protein ThiF [Erwinia persicina]
MSTVVQQVPRELQAAFTLINNDPRMRTNNAWMLSADKRWSLKFTADLSVPCSRFMPDNSVWHLVLWQEGTQIRIELYPDKSEGISATFQHQNYNFSDASTREWTSGNPCLENTPAAFGRNLWGQEPEALLDRISWRLSRLLFWIDAAAQENLATTGDAVELPAFPNQLPFTVIGFSEETDDLPFWASKTGEWGFASSTGLPGARGTRFLREFFDKKGNLIRATKWSPFMRKGARTTDAVWSVLPTLPVLAPWQAPRTWQELSHCFAQCGLSLTDLFSDVGRAVRALRKQRAPGLLLLGFPLENKIGDAPARIHWLALRLAGLSNTMTKRPGFRPTERNRRAWDREQPLSQEPIRWLRTQNWAADQLRTRGEAANDIRSKKVLIIGAGSLGSMIAENLMRIGVVSLGILDADILQTGNLSRHALTMTSVGHNKASALVEHLNRILPDASARSFSCAFPPECEVAKRSLRQYDVIIDCTGDDGVLKALAAFDWQSEKIFISLAMTWRAEGLFAFAASETTFPVTDASSRFAASASPEIDMDEARIEGIGCWHPVFPARADDVQLWAAVGTKFICRVVSAPGRIYEYFKQMPDGTVEREPHEY